MPLQPYNRNAAVAYARKWALGRNPAYYDYSSLGGDCTNFVSQCLFAGSRVMNYARPLGWYYSGANNHSASWTGVPYLFNFLTRKKGVGPIGHQVPIEQVQPGDVSQFAGNYGYFSHTQMIVSVGSPPTLENTLVCTHTFDSLDRPLSTYNYQAIRFIHIDGVQR